MLRCDDFQGSVSVVSRGGGDCVSLGFNIRLESLIFLRGQVRVVLIVSFFVVREDAVSWRRRRLVLRPGLGFGLCSVSLTVKVREGLEGVRG